MFERNDFYWGENKILEQELSNYRDQANIYHANIHNIFYNCLPDQVYTRFPELDPLLISTLKKNFEAYYYGDEETYAETFKNYNAEDEWMMSHIRKDNPAYSCTVCAINIDYNIKDGEQYSSHVPVMVCFQETMDSEPAFRVYFCGIGKSDGKYYIYDYD